MIIVIHCSTAFTFLLVYTSADHVDLVTQVGDILFNNIPYLFVADTKIAVDHDISKGCQVSPFNFRICGLEFH